MDPNSQKNFYKIYIFGIKMFLRVGYAKPISLVMIAWAVLKQWEKNENNFLAVNIKINVSFLLVPYVQWMVLKIKGISNN